MHAFQASSNRKRSRGPAGFTLIEVLCLVVVMAIAATVVMPRVSGNDDLNASAAARVVIADLLYAQNRAISSAGGTSPYVFVSFSRPSQNYAVYSSMATPLTPITDPTTGNSLAVKFGSSGTGSLADASLGAVSFNGQTTVAFDSTGVPYSYNTATQTATELTGTGTIAVISGSHTVTVSVAQDTGDITCQ